MYGSWVLLHKEENMQVQMQKDIDRAIPVEDIEFKFIEGVAFGGAGGLGSTIIQFSSPEEFLKQVPSDEPIYFSSKIYIPSPDFGGRGEAKRTYLAFIKQRSGAMILEGNYMPDDSGWQLKKYSVAEDKLYFQKSNDSTVLVVLIVAFFGTVLVYLWFIDLRIVKLLEPKNRAS
jgi:hypothetical protein